MNEDADKDRKLVSSASIIRKFVTDLPNVSGLNVDEHDNQFQRCRMMFNRFWKKSAKVISVKNVPEMINGNNTGTKPLIGFGKTHETHSLRGCVPNDEMIEALFSFDRENRGESMVDSTVQGEPTPYYKRIFEEFAYTLPPYPSQADRHLIDRLDSLTNVYYQSDGHLVRAEVRTEDTVSTDASWLEGVAPSTVLGAILNSGEVIQETAIDAEAREHREIRRSKHERELREAKRAEELRILMSSTTSKKSTSHMLKGSGKQHDSKRLAQSKYTSSCSLKNLNASDSTIVPNSSSHFNISGNYHEGSGKKCRSSSSNSSTHSNDLLSEDYNPISETTPPFSLHLSKLPALSTDNPFYISLEFGPGSNLPSQSQNLKKSNREMMEDFLNQSSNQKSKKRAMVALWDKLWLRIPPNCGINKTMKIAQMVREMEQKKQTKHQQNLLTDSGDRPLGPILNHPDSQNSLWLTTESDGGDFILSTDVHILDEMQTVTLASKKLKLDSQGFYDKTLMPPAAWRRLIVEVCLSFKSPQSALSNALRVATLGLRGIEPLSRDILALLLLLVVNNSNFPQNTETLKTNSPDVEENFERSFGRPRSSSSSNISQKHALLDPVSSQSIEKCQSETYILAAEALRGRIGASWLQILQGLSIWSDGWTQKNSKATVNRVCEYIPAVIAQIVYRALNEIIPGVNSTFSRMNVYGNLLQIIFWELCGFKITSVALDTLLRTIFTEATLRMPHERQPVKVTNNIKKYLPPSSNKLNGLFQQQQNQIPEEMSSILKSSFKDALTPIKSDLTEVIPFNAPHSSPPEHSIMLSFGDVTRVVSSLEESVLNRHCNPAAITSIAALSALEKDKSNVDKGKRHFRFPSDDNNNNNNLMNSSATTLNESPNEILIDVLVDDITKENDINHLTPPRSEDVNSYQPNSLSVSPSLQNASPIVGIRNQTVKNSIAVVNQKADPEAAPSLIEKLVELSLLPRDLYDEILEVRRRGGDIRVAADRRMRNEFDAALEDAKVKRGGIFSQKKIANAEPKIGQVFSKVLSVSHAVSKAIKISRGNAEPNIPLNNTRFEDCSQSNNANNASILQESNSIELPTKLVSDLSFSSNQKYSNYFERSLKVVNHAFDVIKKALDREIFASPVGYTAKESIQYAKVVEQLSEISKELSEQFNITTAANNGLFATGNYHLQPEKSIEYQIMKEDKNNFALDLLDSNSLENGCVYNESVEFISPLSSISFNHKNEVANKNKIQADISNEGEALAALIMLSSESPLPSPPSSQSSSPRKNQQNFAVPMFISQSFTTLLKVESPSQSTLTTPRVNQSPIISKLELTTSELDSDYEAANVRRKIFNPYIKSQLKSWESFIIENKLSPSVVDVYLEARSILLRESMDDSKNFFSKLKSKKASSSTPLDARTVIDHVKDTAQNPNETNQSTSLHLPKESTKKKILFSQHDSRIRTRSPQSPFLDAEIVRTTCAPPSPRLKRVMNQRSTNLEKLNQAQRLRRNQEHALLMNSMEDSFDTQKRSVSSSPLLGNGKRTTNANDTLNGKNYVPPAYKNDECNHFKTKFSQDRPKTEGMTRALTTLNISPVLSRMLPSKTNTLNRFNSTPHICLPMRAADEMLNSKMLLENQNSRGNNNNNNVKLTSGDISLSVAESRERQRISERFKLVVASNLTDSAYPMTEEIINLHERLLSHHTYETGPINTNTPVKSRFLNSCFVQQQHPLQNATLSSSSSNLPHQIVVDAEDHNIENIFHAPSPVSPPLTITGHLSRSIQSTDCVPSPPLNEVNARGGLTPRPLYAMEAGEIEALEDGGDLSKGDGLVEYILKDLAVGKTNRTGIKSRSKVKADAFDGDLNVSDLQTIKERNLKKSSNTPTDKLSNNIASLQHQLKLMDEAFSNSQTDLLKNKVFSNLKGISAGSTLNKSLNYSNNNLSSSSSSNAIKKKRKSMSIVDLESSEQAVRLWSDVRKKMEDKKIEVENLRKKNSLRELRQLSVRRISAALHSAHPDQSKLELERGGLVSTFKSIQAAKYDSNTNNSENNNSYAAQLNSSQIFNQVENEVKPFSFDELNEENVLEQQLNENKNVFLSPIEDKNTTESTSNRLENDLSFISPSETTKLFKISLNTPDSNFQEKSINNNSNSIHPKPLSINTKTSKKISQNTDENQPALKRQTKSNNAIHPLGTSNDHLNTAMPQAVLNPALDAEEDPSLPSRRHHPQWIGALDIRDPFIAVDWWMAHHDLAGRRRHLIGVASSLPPSMAREELDREQEDFQTAVSLAKSVSNKVAANSNMSPAARQQVFQSVLPKIPPSLSNPLQNDLFDGDLTSNVPVGTSVDRQVLQCRMAARQAAQPLEKLIALSTPTMSANSNDPDVGDRSRMASPLSNQRKDNKSKSGNTPKDSKANSATKKLQRKEEKLREKQRRLVLEVVEKNIPWCKPAMERHFEHEDFALMGIDEKTITAKEMKRLSALKKRNFQSFADMRRKLKTVEAPLLLKHTQASLLGEANHSFNFQGDRGKK